MNKYLIITQDNGNCIMGAINPKQAIAMYYGCLVNKTTSFLFNKACNGLDVEGCADLFNSLVCDSEKIDKIYAVEDIIYEAI